MADTIISALVNLKAMGMLIAGFCFLIFVHELGHFLAAKAVNCKVTQFAIGFGPALFSWRKGIGFRRGSTEPEFMARVNEYADKRAALAEEIWVGFRDVPVAERKFTERHLDEARTVLGLGETEYRANMLLILGGYVRLLGQEDLNPEAVSEDPRSFNRIKAIPKAIILSAGVFMNFVFAIIFFVTAFMAGVKFPPAVVGHVVPDMPAAKAYADGHQGEKEFLGLRAGDRVLQANGHRVSDFNDMRMRVALTSPGDTIALTVERDGVAEPLTYTLTPQKRKEDRFAVIGLGEPISLEILKTDREADQPPLSAELVARGVRPGMTITAAGGKPIKRFDQLEAALAAERGKPVDVTFTDLKTQQSVVAPLTAAPDIRVIGLMPVARAEMVINKAPAQAAGIKVGDVFVRIGDRHWPDAQSVREAIRQNRGREFSIVVLRDGKEVKIDSITTTSAGTIGIKPDFALDLPVIGSVAPKSPFASVEPHLAAGTRLISVNGAPVASLSDFQRLLQDAVDPSRETSVSIEIERDIAGKPRETHAVKFTAEQAKALRDAEWSAPASLPVQTLITPLVAGGPLEAVTLGLSKTRQYMFQTYQSLYLLIIGAVPASEMHGMIGIVQQGTIVARDHGWAFLVFFLGLISINLVVMNFLPIPILDGGQMVFLIIEKIKGSPVSIRAQTIATYIGLALIGTLLLMTLYFDTARLFGFN